MPSKLERKTLTKKSVKISDLYVENFRLITYDKLHSKFTFVDTHFYDFCEFFVSSQNSIISICWNLFR